MTGAIPSLLPRDLISRIWLPQCPLATASISENRPRSSRRPPSVLGCVCVRTSPSSVVARLVCVGRLVRAHTVPETTTDDDSIYDAQDQHSGRKRTRIRAKHLSREISYLALTRRLWEGNVLPAISLEKSGNFAASLLLILLSLFIPPILFGLAYAPFASQPISLASASAISSGAITVNGVILGFVLLVLFDNVAKGKITTYKPDYLARVLLVFLDGGFVSVSLREIYREMTTLAALPADPTLIVIINSFFVPWRFGIYVATRIVIILLMMSRRQG